MKKNLPIYILIVIFVLIIALSARAYFSQYRELTSENLDAFLRGFGPWALAVFIFTYLIASPIPLMATLLSATGGLLFGPWVGMLVAMGASIATSLVPFYLARRLGREWVQAKMKGGKLESFLARVDDGSGFKFILLLRLVGVLPWEMQNYVAGVSKANLPTYFLATVLGMTPITVGLVLVGTTARQPGSWQFIASLAYLGIVFLGPILAVFLQQRKKV